MFEGTMLILTLNQRLTEFAVASEICSRRLFHVGIYRMLESKEINDVEGSANFEIKEW